MAKLTRVPAKVFAASAAADEIGQFGSAVAGSKLETADVATIQGLSAWLAGWSEALVSGNRYPALQEMNGLLKVLSYQGAYALQEGIAEYDSATTYFIGSIVKKTGTFEIYGSLTDTNVGNALADGTKWQLLCILDKVVATTGDEMTGQLTLSNGVQIAEKLRLSGQEYYQAGYSDLQGVGLTLAVNRTNYRSVGFVDTANIAVNTTNPNFIIALDGQLKKTWIFSCATDQITFLPLEINGSNITTKANAYNFIAGGAGNFITANAYIDSNSNWQRFNTAQPAQLLKFDNNGNFEKLSATAGANPISWGTPQTVLTVVANGNVGGNYYRKLSDGSVECWGYATCASNGLASISLPITFNTIQTITTGGVYNTTSTFDASIYAYSTSTLTISFYNAKQVFYFIRGN